MGQRPADGHDRRRHPHDRRGGLEGEDDAADTRKRSPWKQGNHHEEEDEAEVLGKLEREIDLVDESKRRPPHRREAHARRLHRSASPAMLLNTKGVKGLRQLRRDLQLVHVREATSREIGPHREVEVLGQAGRGPSPGALDGAPAPQPRRAVEAEEAFRHGTAALFDGEVRVEERRLRARGPRRVSVQVPPRGLHHVGVGAVAKRGVQQRHGLFEKVGSWNEVGVEDGDEVAARRRETVRQCARFVSRSRASANVQHVHASTARRRCGRRDDGRRLIGGVIEDLHFELRPAKCADCFDDPRGNRGLVVERNLHGDDVRSRIFGSPMRKGRTGRP